LVYERYKCQFDDFQNFYNELKYCSVGSLEKEPQDILLVIKKVSIKQPNDAAIDYPKAEAFDDIDSSIYLSNPYINNQILNDDEKSIYKSGYVKKNYIKKSCWYSLIIDIYKEPIENYRKKISLTYQSLQDIVKKNILLLHNTIQM
jgi:hypothetical protein